MTLWNFFLNTMTNCLGFDVSGMGMGTGMPMMSQAGEPGLPLLLTETRQQNTELRLSVSKMQDKIDQLLEKVSTRLSVCYCLVYFVSYLTTPCVWSISHSSGWLSLSSYIVGLFSWNHHLFYAYTCVITYWKFCFIIVSSLTVGM